MVTSALSSALAGLQYNQRSLARHADRIASYGGDPPPADVSLEKEMVGVLEARRGYEANLAVVRASDDMIGSLLDVLA